LKPHLKITKAIKGPGHDSSGGAPAKQVEDPEFRPQYCQTNSKKKKQKNKTNQAQYGPLNVISMLLLEIEKKMVHWSSTFDLLPSLILFIIVSDLM
jgi:hypothetical protein